MTGQARPPRHPAPHRRTWAEIPQPTLSFWVILLLAGSAGETSADLLDEHSLLRPGGTSALLAVLLAAALLLRRRQERRPWLYWFTVIAVATLATLCADRLAQHAGFSLGRATTTLAGATLLVFSSWYAAEQTLAVDRIRAGRGELFYWLAILVTFALGTAVSDLLSRDRGVGYGTCAVIFGSLVLLVTAARFRLGIPSTITLWVTCALTRPVGVAVGDALSQPRGKGGLAIGALVTSLVILSSIGVAVTGLDTPGRPTTS